MAGRGEGEFAVPREPGGQVTRRSLLARATALGLSSSVAARYLPSAAPALAASGSGAVPLPSPRQVRADFQRMVDFGPRLTGSDSHNNYIAWLEQEFVKAGCQLIPCDTYQTERWLAQEVGLQVLHGSAAGPVKVGTYYPRSQETPAGGVTGPLVYGGTAPALSISGTDLSALQAAIARYPSDLASWASATSGTLAGATPGSILLVDLPMPVPLTGAAFLPAATYLNWSGHTEADWTTIDYKRLWIEPGLSVPLAPFQGMGAAGVVFIVDASFAALEGGYLPFTHGFEPLPALYVDRDTGAQLRTQAMSRPQTRLTLTATRAKVPTSSITAVLPGASDETLIFNTHTDGQGFVEENGGVAFVALARYFASLPASKRLKRTLVFAAWPGHMVADLPQTQGWIDAHPDIVKRAAAALTIEHLGCSEWIDTVDAGYRPTGEAELFGIWTTQGKMFQLTRDTIVAHDIPRAALLRPPVQFGVGAAFQSTGVPQIGAIAGPEYLLTISPNGDLDKLDEALAARQIAWLADLATRLDGVPAADLRQGDPTLGAGGMGGSSVAPVKQLCAPAAPAPSGAAAGAALTPAEVFVIPVGLAQTLTLRYFGRRHALKGILVELNTNHGGLADVVVELHHRGRLMSRGRAGRVTSARRRFILTRARGRRFPAGRYTIVVRVAGRAPVRRAVPVG
jgi:hypothetical protein